MVLFCVMVVLEDVEGGVLVGDVLSEVGVILEDVEGVGVLDAVCL